MLAPVPLPPPAGPGDRVGVAALSGPIDPQRLEWGLAALADFGFEPVPADNLSARHGLFAGSDAERLAAFHKLAADPEITAIFFARGGHGLLRVLPGIDWDLLARHPRAYIGYSDLTPFLLEVVRRLGIVAFHGPMVAADFARGLSPEELSSLLGALSGDYPRSLPLTGSLPGLVGLSTGVPVRGPLLGGCLSLLTATLGTPWAPDLDGAIAFWEEIQEPPFRLDRMLTHLRLAGKLDGVRGMVLGHLTGTDRAPREILEQALPGVPFPLGWGLPAGHVSPNWTLPLGLAAELDAGEARLVLG
jgi:muramoyltetrapeptide carboxypeptidase